MKKLLAITVLVVCGMVLFLVGIALVAPYDPNGLNGMLFDPPSTETSSSRTSASGCQPHAQLQSAASVAAELGRTEIWVLQNHKINLWNAPGQGRTRKVGELIPGSRAVILEEQGDAYKVKSPLDGSTGWISSVQVARTIHQDVSTRKPCRP